MKVTVTGATGLIGTRLVAALARARRRGDRPVARPGQRTRGARRRGRRLGPAAGPAPCAALDGRDAVVHLAGEPVAQRWNDDGQAARSASRARSAPATSSPGSLEAEPRPAALDRGLGGRLLRQARRRARRRGRPARRRLPRARCAWPGRPRPTRRPRRSALRVVRIRTGVVLDRDGGALEKMLPPFKAGVGGPVAGGGQYMPWIHADDVVGLYLAALDGDWTRGLQRLRARARDQQGVLQGARPRAAPPRASRRSRRSPSGCSTAR